MKAKLVKESLNEGVMSDEQFVQSMKDAEGIYNSKGNGADPTAGPSMEVNYEVQGGEVPDWPETHLLTMSFGEAYRTGINDRTIVYDPEDGSVSVFKGGDEDDEEIEEDGWNLNGEKNYNSVDEFLEEWGSIGACINDAWLDLEHLSDEHGWSSEELRNAEDEVGLPDFDSIKVMMRNAVNKHPGFDLKFYPKVKKEQYWEIDFHFDQVSEHGQGADGGWFRYLPESGIAVVCLTETSGEYYQTGEDAVRMEDEENTYTTYDINKLGLNGFQQVLERACKDAEDKKNNWDM